PDLDAGPVPDESADLRWILHDHQQAPRLPIPSASHLPAARPHVAAVLGPLHVGVHAEAVEDLDALLGRTSVRLESLDPVLDYDGQAEFLLELMSASGDDRDFLDGRQGRIACQASFVLVHLLRPDLLDPGGMRPTTAHSARRLRPRHGAADPRDAGDAMAFPRPTD